MIYEYNENFFDKIDTQEKAYWLGFLYADGCVLENGKNMSLEISLAAKDEEHLKKFLKSIDANIKIRRRTVICSGKECDTRRINVCSTKMCRDLIKLGCTPRKSLTLKFPSENIIQSEFIFDFLRGYFDGDGCISFITNGPKLTSSLISFVGTKDFLDGIYNNMVKNGIPVRYNVKKVSNAYEMRIYGRDKIIEIYNKFYGRENCVFLTRKKEKLESYIAFVKENYPNFYGKNGVYYDKRNKDWKASYFVEGKRITKIFHTFEEAKKFRLYFELKNCPLI